MKRSQRQTTKAYQAAYSKAHKPENLAYYYAHREHMISTHAAWRKSHKAEILAYNTAYREKHKDTMAAYQARYMVEYRKAHRDKARDAEARHRATKRAAFVEPIIRALLYLRDTGRCHLCGKRVKGRWHLEHIVPLSRGGDHSYRNVAMACPKCNLRKGGKIIGQLRLF